MKHKYIRHSEVGFILWPAGHNLHHDQVASLFDSGRIISAGFVSIIDGGVFCFGSSDTLEIKSLEEDSMKLAEQLGLIDD